MGGGSIHIISGSALFPDITDNPGVLVTISVPLLVDEASATAFQVGPNGATNPTLIVKTDVASAITGLQLQSNASGSGVIMAALGGTNESIILNPKGNGFVTAGKAGVAGKVYIGSFADDTSYGAIYLGKTTPGSTNWQFLSAEGDSVYYNTTVSHVFQRSGSDRFAVLNDTSYFTKPLGVGISTVSYGLHVSFISLITAGQTMFVQDATATTGKTTCVLKGGAVAGNILEIRNSSNTLNGSITEAGVIDMASYKVGGTAGVDFSGSGATFAALTTVTFVKGILTAAS